MKNLKTLLWKEWQEYKYMLLAGILLLVFAHYFSIFMSQYSAKMDWNWDRGNLFGMLSLRLFWCFLPFWSYSVQRRVPREHQNLSPEQTDYNHKNILGEILIRYNDTDSSLNKHFFIPMLGNA